MEHEKFVIFYVDWSRRDGMALDKMNVSYIIDRNKNVHN